MPRYRVIEVDRRGSTHWEEFDAPNDKTALKRVWDEVRGQWFQLWRDGVLVHEGRPKRGQTRQTPEFQLAGRSDGARPGSTIW